MRRQRANTDQALNVTPLIDILSNIVFFLMLSISFMHLRQLSASLPQTSDGNDLDTEAALTVTVSMDDAGFHATARDPSRKNGDERMDFPKLDGKWDTAGLSIWLRGIKLKAPRSDAVILTPAPGMMLSDVVAAMDAVREAPASNGGGMIPTFPKVVLSSVVR